MPIPSEQRPDLNQMASMRFTIGTYDTGEKFTYYDNFRNHTSATQELTRPWTGYTMFFDRDNDHIDSQIASVCSSLCCFVSREEDVHMAQNKRVWFNEALTTFVAKWQRCTKYRACAQKLSAVWAGAPELPNQQKYKVFLKVPLTSCDTVHTCPPH